MGSPNEFNNGNANVNNLNNGNANDANNVNNSGGAVVPVINLTAVSLNGMTGQGTVDHPFEVN